MAGFTDPAAWYAGLPVLYAAAAALITSPGGAVLLVKPNYRDHWSLPGGICEHAEPPHVACGREVEEELGLVIAVGRLLTVSWTAPEGERHGHVSSRLTRSVAPCDIVGNLACALGRHRDFAAPGLAGRPPMRFEVVGDRGKYVSGRRPDVPFAVAVMAIGTPILAYASLFWAHALLGACLLFAFAAALKIGDERFDFRWAVAVGLAAGWATVTEYPAAPASALLAIFALGQAWPRGTAARWRVIAGVAVFAFGILAGAGIAAWLVPPS